ncbi:MAG: ABC transporter permease [Rhizomicrobium sp.]
MTDWALAFTLARREMRSGLSGFRIFFACLVLGVAAIAGVGSLSSALLTGLALEGRTLLGGDVSVHLVHRPADADERAFLARHGRVSEAVSMRAMAYALKGEREQERQLIELKAVDRSYPLYGAVGLAPAQSLQTALACTKTPKPVCGATVEQTLLDRLHLPLGGKLRIGAGEFCIASVLVNEPDRISGGFSLGPHVLVSKEGLAQTGLGTIGSLIEYDYRVALPAGTSIDRFKQEAQKKFPEAGWEIRDRSDAAPGIRRFVEQVTMFLTLVGLTALAIGGVGAGQAVTAFLDRKREEIATLKTLGAEGGLIFLVYFLQVMAIASAAVVVGLTVGAALPFLVPAFFAADLPAPARFAIYPGPLLLAALFGLLSAAAFAIPPLARAREIMPASLFRDVVARAPVRGRLPYLAAAALAGLSVIALALVLAPSANFAGWFLAGIAGTLLLLRALASVLRATLRRLPRPEWPSVRLALANLTRPGAASASIIMALGLGLTLLAAVTLLDATLSAQVKDNLPTLAPTFFFVDIQPREAAAFDRTIARFSSARDYKRTPMIRGRITALNGTPAERAHVAASALWALSGDRGITYAAAPPKDSEITSGRWWPANYQGPTLISFDAELAQGLGLKLGDTLTLNVLGRELTGKIANFRHVDFSNGNQNFILILSPGLIDKAPHSFLATVRVALRDEEPLYRAVTDRFPDVSTVRVKDAIAQVNGLLQQLSDGVRAASLVTILAGLLVLAGAIAAGQRARLYDATVMKVLGATRVQIAGIYALEYGLIGAATGLVALAAGTAAAYGVSERIFAVPLVFDFGTVLATVLGGSLATLGFGLVAAWSALAARPAEQLRHP